MLLNNFQKIRYFQQSAEISTSPENTFVKIQHRKRISTTNLLNDNNTQSSSDEISIEKVPYSNDNTIGNGNKRGGSGDDGTNNVHLHYHNDNDDDNDDYNNVMMINNSNNKHIIDANNIEFKTNDCPCRLNTSSLHANEINDENHDNNLFNDDDGYNSMNVTSIQRQISSPMYCKRTKTNYINGNNLSITIINSGKYLIAVHRKIIRQDTYFLSHHKTRPSLFGVPLLIPCYENGTNKDLYCAVWMQVNRLLSPLPPVADQANHAADW